MLYLGINFAKSEKKELKIKIRLYSDGKVDDDKVDLVLLKQKPFRKD